VRSRKLSVKRLLGEYLAGRGTGPVTETEWEEIRARFDTASSGYLRRLLRDSGLPLAPLVEGVRQQDLDNLERSLIALERVYSEADRDARRSACRAAVIEAKDHARLALRRGDAGKLAAREEMIRWMLVWLENPAAFPSWVRLRKTRLADAAGTADEGGE